MALKFLNKKGWHTGSLRNIENVWKAEQKHEAEQKKLEELRKQIVEERERSEFRLLQEQAGLVPKQERLEFLYDSGLAVGKGSTSSGGGFKALESSSLPPPPKPDASSSSTKPGALFEEKQQSSNDAWRKLHSDPLLMIRQREQEALSRVKNNPVQMAMIRKSVEATKTKKKKHDDDAPKRRHRHKKKHDKESSPKHHSDSDNYTSKERRKSSGTSNTRPISEDELSDEDIERRSSSHRSHKYREGRSSKHHSDSKEGRKSRPSSEDELIGGAHKSYKYKEGRSSKHHSDSDNYTSKEGRKSRPGSEDELSGGDIKRRSSGHKSYKYKEGRSSGLPEATSKKNDTGYNGESGEQKGRQDDGRRLTVIRETKPLRKRNHVKLSEEERSARLQEMERDAVIHEEQRWKRLKKAEERDVEEAIPSKRGRSFLEDVEKSVYGTAKGGSSTIEESVRRRTHYSQGRSEAGEGNAFRR